MYIWYRAAREHDSIMNSQGREIEIPPNLSFLGDIRNMCGSAGDE